MFGGMGGKDDIMGSQYGDGDRGAEDGRASQLKKMEPIKPRQILDRPTTFIRDEVEDDSAHGTQR